MLTLTRSPWTVQDSAKLYRIGGWGDPYFRINEAGHVAVAPQGFDHRSQGIDLYTLVRDLQARGVQLPMLIRFPDIVADRIGRICGSFQRAIERLGYPNVYRGVYPVKVNQQRHLVEEVVKHGRPYGFGLEAGSKPELLIALSLLDTPGSLLICNGYKDRDYIETAILSRQMGRNTIIVLERLHELTLVVEVAQQLGIRPVIGVRAKLAAQGMGRWGSSAGDRAKFGLTIPEIMQVVERLRGAGLLDCLQLLHYHIGSQVSAVSVHGRAVREATRLFAELAHGGAPMQYLDMGGGLGIDYDGSQSTAPTSQSYTLEDYALTLVQTVLTTCQENQVPAPVLITESGRALMSHQSVLVMDVMGINQVTVAPVPVAAGDHPIAQALQELLGRLNPDNLVADYRYAQDLKEQALRDFTAGSLSMADRARIETLFWNVCAALRDQVHLWDPDSPIREELDHLLASIYYCNFSVFQSVPDSWAIDQVFPIMPIHRLDEEPQQRGILADLTCDSDGKIAHFIGENGHTHASLPLHTWDPDQPYLLGIFLGGAYQEILGDLHNLFGDTNAVHIQLNSDGEGYRVAQVVKGDTVSKVLGYVQYSGEDLLDRIHQATEAALQAKRISLEEAYLLQHHFEDNLRAYTYLR
ncbi:MAG: biosynthetic arginine decarboxylase [Thermostichales cyanobacterium DRC_bins_46]